MESFSGNLPFESRDIQTDHDIEKNITQSFNKLGKRRHIRSCSRVSNENSSVGNGIFDVHMIICPGLSLLAHKMVCSRIVTMKKEKAHVLNVGE